MQIGSTLSGQNGYLKCAAGATAAFTDSPAWMLIKSAAEASGESTAPLVLALSSACSPMYRVFRALSESNVTTAQAYAGDVGIARVNQAFSSLIGTAVAAVPVLITGIITMAWIALTFALYITGPFKLAFATYTGKAKMAKEWAGDLVHAWASRLAYGILLSLTILIIAWMLASTLSFGLRLVWLGVILFFFWKLVQKVQELIRPGAASIAPNLAGDVQRRTAGGAKTLTRTAARTTVGAGAGVLVAGQRRRMMAADPTRGPAASHGRNPAHPGVAAHRRRPWCRPRTSGRPPPVLQEPGSGPAHRGQGRERCQRRRQREEEDHRQGGHRIDGHRCRPGCPHRRNPESEGQQERHRPGHSDCRSCPAAPPAAEPRPGDRAVDAHRATKPTAPNGSPETVAIPRPGPPPQTDRIPRPPETVAIPRPGHRRRQIRSHGPPRPSGYLDPPRRTHPPLPPPDPPHPPPGADGNDDDAPDRRPLEPASAGPE